MRDKLQRAKRAYNAEGLGGLATGIFNHFRRPIEKQTVSRTRFEIPYYVRKHNKRAKRFTRLLAERGIGPRIAEAGLSDYKSSDTLFILGSGSSITQITDAQWQHIDERDSVGLNRWPIHEFTPTYHVFETRMEPEYEEFTRTYWNLLNSRQAAYENIPIILKDVSTVYRRLEPDDLPGWLAGNLIVSCDSSYNNIVTPASSVERNEALLQHLYDRGHFNSGEFNILYRKRGSISYLIHFALCLGYENIVLCGVDMVDSTYFFDEREAHYQEQGIPIPRPPSATHDNHNNEETHKTNDPDAGQLTLEKVIYSLREIVLKNEGVTIYVENEKSALHPRLPLYPYEEV
ncbi:hypothetical protein [Halovenus sp. HT40]|uniref:hypothetical protein n=1 Tax=Halovenus sp. HT40 TaxID=3126691 RepID=UPI00300EF18A